MIDAVSSGPAGEMSDGRDLGALAGIGDRRRLAVAPARSGGSGAEDDGDLARRAATSPVFHIVDLARCAHVRVFRPKREDP